MLTDQEKRAFKQTVLSNQHEVFIILMAEMDTIVRSSSAATKPNVQEA